MTGATRKPGFTVAVLATLLAAVVVLLGAYARLTAGLGCPDWPGCYGFVHVPLSEAQLAPPNCTSPTPRWRHRRAGTR